MLGFFLPPKFRVPVLVILLIMLVGGLVYGMANDVFAHNSRETLRLEREAPITR